MKIAFKISLFILIVICVFAYFYDIYPGFFKERSPKPIFSANVFIKKQKMSPIEAREIVIKEAMVNPMYMRCNNNFLWFNMYVVEDEYFFPPFMDKGGIKERGYYINPETRNIRHVDNDFYFKFPFFFDLYVINVFDPYEK